jgi:hypothetical protein
VWARNEFTGEEGFKPVVRLFRNTADSVVLLTYQREAGSSRLVYFDTRFERDIDLDANGSSTDMEIIDGGMGECERRVSVVLSRRPRRLPGPRRT